MMRVLALLALLSAPAIAGTAPLGNVVIHYDDAKWTVSSLSTGSNARTVMFTCISERCFRGRPVVWASATPAGADTPECGGSRPSIPDNWRESGPIAAGPLTLDLVTTFSGCRAYVPARRTACAADGTFVYRFSTASHGGCRGVEGAPEELFRELLSGISTP